MAEKVSVFKTTQKIIMGIGAIGILPEEVERLGGKSILIVTDEGLVKAGISDRVADVLRGNPLRVTTFGTVPPEPPMQIIGECLRAAEDAEADFIIGLGGGSSMDVAKIVSVLMTNRQSLTEVIGVNLVRKQGLPHILIPTTAGTGSEVTPIAILTDTDEHLKKGVVSDYLFPEVAVLDAALTASLPPFPTAASGMDALIHAVEAFISVNATPYTDHLAERAMRLIAASIRSAWANGSNLDARMQMLEGSMLAGQAFANAGVAAAHAFAYPLGGEFHVSHGVANTVMLCPTIRFSMLANLEKYARVGDILCPEAARGKDAKQRAEASITYMQGLAADMELPLRMRDLGVPEDAVESLAHAVLKVTRLLVNNPRKVTLDDARKIYREAY